MASRHPAASCSPDSHTRLKRDSLWDALPLVGRQPYPADADGPAGALVLKNCPDCQSTLAREEVA